MTTPLTNHVLSRRLLNGTELKPTKIGDQYFLEVVRIHLMPDRVRLEFEGGDSYDVACGGMENYIAPHGIRLNIELSDVLLMKVDL